MRSSVRKGCGMKIWILFFAVVLQGLIFVIDEYFHLKRSLGRFERVGHPIDTLFTLLTLSIPMFLDFNGTNVTLFLISSLVSCLVVTKDEFVHHVLCDKWEQWLHALLFVLHPWLFVYSFFLWILNQPFWGKLVGNYIFVGESDVLKLIVETGTQSQFYLTLFVFMYQVVSWNLIYPLLQKFKPKHY